MAFESKKQAKKWRSEPRPVSDLVSVILDPVMQQRAGMTAQLVMAWADIVGPDHAEHTRPEKLEWPKSWSDDDPFQPAILKIACDGARAIYLQHEAGRIIERVNTFFGFTAITRVRIVQKPVHQPTRPHRNEPRPLDPVAARKLDEILQSVEDEDLRNSLKKMGQGVFNSGSSRSG